MYFVHENEASESNLHINKRIFFWSPFMHSVYNGFIPEGLLHLVILKSWNSLEVIAITRNYVFR